MESLLIELPTWLGDSVMVSGSFLELVRQVGPTRLGVVGPPGILELLLPLVPREVEVVEVWPVVRRGRWGRLIKGEIGEGYRLSPESLTPTPSFKLPKTPTPLPLRQFQMGVSFRSSLYSQLMVRRFARKGYHFPRGGGGHLVERYSQFVNRITGGDGVHRPTLPFPKAQYPRPAVGINPGAAYGPAKRWPPEKFAEVANRLGEEFQLVLFGGPGEEGIVQEIEGRLKVPAVNLCGKLTLPELASQIAGLSLFITNDSGPMHIGAAYNIPLVAIFGPTDWRETSPYSPVAQIARIPIECAPCKRRECPLGHHRCMEELSPERVVELARLAIELKRKIESG